MRKHLLGLAMTIPLSLGTAHAAPILLIAAGGGGGSGATAAGASGQVSSSGTSGTDATGGAKGTMGTGGGAGTGIFGNGAGGAGLISGGGGGDQARGGMTGPSYSGGYAIRVGGFGGGGGGGYAGGGGGGGYSGGGGGGGGGGYGGGGGGGGSFLESALTLISGPSVAPGNTTAKPTGADGFVVISLIGAGSFSQTFSYTGAVQGYTFDTTGLYSIVAVGGQGGDDLGYVGGLGAEIGGKATFTAGSKLELVVGGGGGLASGGGAGGGGGSFVFETYAASAPATINVPEPASLALLGTGLIGLLATRRKRATA